MQTNILIGNIHKRILQITTKFLRPANTYFWSHFYFVNISSIKSERSNGKFTHL